MADAAIADEDFYNEETETGLSSQENAEAQTERVYTEIEQQALANGWDPDGKKSAEEWECLFLVRILTKVFISFR